MLSTTFGRGSERPSSESGRKPGSTDPYTGGRAGHETLDGVLETNLDLEDASGGEKHRFLLLLDYKNFFDCVVQEIVWGVATWWGAPRYCTTDKKLLDRTH